MSMQARDRKPNQWWLALLLAPFCNLAVTVALTLLLNVARTARGRDDTLEADYQEAA